MPHIELYAKEAPQIKYDKLEEELQGISTPYTRQIITRGSFKPVKTLPLISSSTNHETIQELLLEEGEFKIGNYFNWSGTLGRILNVSYPQIVGRVTPDGLVLEYTLFLEVEF